jgi:6,7-dimethyl-8-ribityllumazine synthase
LSLTLSALDESWSSFERYNQKMVKGITFIEPIESSDEYKRLGELLAALGFEPGKGWKDENGEGAAFLAPVGNLELITGTLPATPRLLIEVTQLDQVHGAVSRWIGAGESVLGEGLSSVKDTHWNSRLFTLRLSKSLEVGFWQAEDPDHGLTPAIEGSLSADGMRFGVVTTRWNTVITDRLLQGSLDCLRRSGAKTSDIHVVRVPGAWEIPNAARTLAESGKVDAIVTLGCLLRGETAHYEAIYNEVARGIGQSQQETGVPHAFGVLTCETLEQALDRAGLKAGNKGFEAASAAIEMVSIQRQLRAKQTTSAEAVR